MAKAIDENWSHAKDLRHELKELIELSQKREEMYRAQMESQLDVIRRLKIIDARRVIQWNLLVEQLRGHNDEFGHLEFWQETNGDPGAVEKR